MANWRRAWWPGGTWFFTVNLLERRNNRLLVEQIDLLRHSVAKVQQAHPFAIHAWVVLPDHLHCILSLPEGDTDFPLRWRLIKSHFSRALPVTERRSQTRLIYCVERQQDRLFEPRLRALSQRTGVQLQIMQRDQDGLLDASQLFSRHPAACWFCGPQGMRAMLARWLPRSLLHFEHFEFR